MIVLDTHAWLWWTSAPSRLSRRARAAIEAADRVGVCTISAWEIAMLVVRERIALDRRVDDWVRQALAHEPVLALPLTSGAAVAAALLEREGFAGDPADRMIYATAREQGARLVTRDRDMRAFDAARTVW